MTQGYCLGLYTFSDSVVNANLRQLLVLKKSMAQVDYCSKVHLVLEKSDESAYRGNFRILLVCKIGVATKILIFGYEAESTAAPRAEITVGSEVSIMRIEGLMYGGMLFIAYLTDKNELHYMSKLTDFSADSAIPSSFAVFDSSLP